MAQIDWHDFVVVETIECKARTAKPRKCQKCMLHLLYCHAACVKKIQEARFTAEDDNLTLAGATDVLELCLEAPPIDPSTHAPKGAPTTLEQAGSSLRRLKP